MTAARWLTFAAAMLTIVALSGCTQQSAGSPLPDDTATTGTETTEPTTDTESSSERPSEIKLDGKDPCGLIPQSDWPKFGIERPGERSEEPNFKSPHCYYSGAGDVTLVVTEGVEAWTDGSRNVEIKDAESIEGFPAITLANKVDRYSCYTAVDVADGQYLLTTARPIDQDPDSSAKCDIAYDLAVSAMKTLVAS